VTPAKPAKPKSDAGIGSLVRTIALGLLIFLVPRVVLCQPYTIPSGSMEPTLLVGDYVAVTKFAYGWSRHSVPFSPPLGEGRVMGQAPRRGDIVVFKKPSNGRTDMIKRLVGLPGDRLQVTRGVLHINGAPVKREYLSSGVEEKPYRGAIEVAQFRETLPGGKAFATKSYGPDTLPGNTGVYVVPAGCYFMMGDNRDNSLDSRFDPGEIAAGQSACPWDSALDAYLPGQLGMGYVPFDDLVGRADMVVLSWRPGTSLWKPWTLVSNIRWDRAFHALGSSPVA
jgi:signal peptidase I